MLKYNMLLIMNHVLYQTLCYFLVCDYSLKLMLLQKRIKIRNVYSLFTIN